MLEQVGRSTVRKYFVVGEDVQRQRRSKLSIVVWKEVVLTSVRVGRGVNNVVYVIVHDCFAKSKITLGDFMEGQQVCIFGLHEGNSKKQNEATEDWEAKWRRTVLQLVPRCVGRYRNVPHTGPGLILPENDWIKKEDTIRKCEWIL